MTDADPKVALPAHGDAAMSIGVDGTTVPGVARYSKEERGDGVDGFWLIDVLDDDHARVRAADILEGAGEGGKGDGVLTVGTVMVASGKWLAGRAGDETVDGGCVDGELGGGIGEHAGREEAAAGPGVAKEGTEAAPSVGGVGVGPATRVQVIKGDGGEAHASVRGSDADGREATQEVVGAGGSEGALQGSRMECTAQGDAGLTAGEVATVQRTPKG